MMCPNNLYDQTEALDKLANLAIYEEKRKLQIVKRESEWDKYGTK